jgi:hypothetical protein
MDSRTQFGSGSLLLATGTIVLAVTASVMMLTLPTPVAKSTSPERRQLGAATLRNARIRERYFEFLPESVETRRRPAERSERDRVTTANKSASMNQTELAQIQRQLSRLDSALNQIQQQQQMLVQQQLDSQKAVLSQNSSLSPSASPQQFSMDSGVKEHSGVTATVQTVSSQSATASNPESATDNATSNDGSSETSGESSSDSSEQASTDDSFSELLSPEATSTEAEPSEAQDSTPEPGTESPAAGGPSGADPAGSDSDSSSDTGTTEEVTFPEFPPSETSESSLAVPQSKIEEEEVPSPFEPDLDRDDTDPSDAGVEGAAASELSIPESLIPADAEDSLVPVMIPKEQEISSSRLLRTSEDDIPFIAALGWSEDDEESRELDELMIPPSDNPHLIRAVVTGPAAEKADPLIERTHREQASTLSDGGDFWNTAMAVESGIPARELRPVPQDSSSFESQLPTDSSMTGASPAIFEYEYSPQLTYDTNFQSAPMELEPSHRSTTQHSRGTRRSAQYTPRRRGLLRIPKFLIPGFSGGNRPVADAPANPASSSWNVEPHGHPDLGALPSGAPQYSPAPIVQRSVYSASNWNSVGPAEHFVTTPSHGRYFHPSMNINDGFIDRGYYETSPNIYSPPQPTVPYVMVPAIVMPDFDFVDFEMPEFGGQTFHRAYSAIRFASHTSAIP